MPWSFWSRRVRHRELEEEIAFDLAAEAAENARAGMSPQEAARRSRREFGNVLLVEEATRESWGWSFLDRLAQDVTYGLRRLARSPGFTVVAVLSLALGIGANTAIYSLIDAVMLKYLPVSHPKELLEVGGLGGDSFFSWWFTNPRWEALREQQQVFSGVFAFGQVRFNLNQNTEARRVQGAWVSGEYFTTLGVRAALGRTLMPADDQRGCRAIAVLGYDFWQSEYDARRDVLGRSISLDGHPFAIVGVVQQGFFGLDVGNAAKIIAPICAEKVIRGVRSAIDDRGAFWLRVIGRPKAGLDPRRVNAELKLITPRVLAAAMPAGLNAEDRRSYEEGTFRTLPAGNGLSSVREQYHTTLLVLMAAVSLVLLIACANVANLLLARAELRQHETAIRMAIGAGRSRLIRQFLTESLLLSASGAAIGMLFARWIIQLVLRFLIQYGSFALPPLFLDLGIDARVPIFTIVVAVATGLLFGIAPAWRGTRANAQSAIKADSRGIIRGHSRFSLGKALVMVQVALSLVLATGAELMMGTFRNLVAADMGFDRNDVLVAIADFSQVRDSPGQIYSTLEQVREKLRALPGVLSASFSDVTPISGVEIFPSIEVEGFVPNTPEDSTAWTTSVSKEYFKSLSTPLLAGRDFDGLDVKGAPLVAIVNESMAKKFFGGRPIGRYFRTGFIASRQPIQIVGEVKNAKYRSVREEALPAFYTSIGQVERFDVLPANFEIQTDGVRESVIPAIKAALAEVIPATSFEFRTLAMQVDESLNRERLLATLSGFFGVLSLPLAAIGLYAVMSYSVARRRSEIGIRIALGAEQTRVLGMVLGEVGVLIISGLAVGLGVTVTTTRFVSSLLYGIKPNDPLALFLAAAALAAVALFAAFFPALRASKLDPLMTLRNE
jgi:putative ABC transport system permease protein